MDLSYFFEGNVSPGLNYLEKAITELEVNVTEKTTPIELYGIYNGIFARVLDMLIEDLKKNELP